MIKKIEDIDIHKGALLFAGGIAAAIIAKKALESKTVKDAAVDIMAKAMVCQKEAEETFQNMKEDAEDICQEAEEKNKKSIYVEEKPKK
ncbi:MAG: DUF1490 family protein [Methanobacteriaceae archaeon]|jgi:ABC-type Fe3+-hydroxamate transport system substrate-binding protein|nr:DUF1490 family protein [Methanobacteriaceae archaeon]